MKIQTAVLIPAIISVVGCASPVPVAENFPLSYQKVARTAHHWDIVAKDIVEQTAIALNSKEQLKGRGIFIPASPRNTAFDNAFRNFMINHLVDQEFKVAVCRTTDSASQGGFAVEASDVEVRYETQVIAHGADLSNYRPGLWTALASGVAVIRNASHADLSRGQANAAGIALGALADWGAGHAADPTHTELIVTTTIAEGNRFILRRSDIYYVPDADAPLFFQRLSQKSSCPQDKSAAAPALSQDQGSTEAEREFARWKLFDKEMRRNNPNYRPKPFVGSY